MKSLFLIGMIACALASCGTGASITGSRSSASVVLPGDSLCYFDGSNVELVVSSDTLASSDSCASTRAVLTITGKVTGNEFTYCRASILPRASCCTPNSSLSRWCKE